MYDRANGDASLFARTIAVTPKDKLAKREASPFAQKAATFQGTTSGERRIAGLSENDAHQPVVPSAAAQHKKLAVDRVGQYNPGTRACNPAVVQINAAGFDCAPGFSLGRDDLAQGEQIGCGQPFPLKLPGGNLAGRDVGKDIGNFGRR